MFHEKLAEAKEERERGLSLGQKAGIIGAGLAGAAAPVLGAAYSQPTSAFNKFLEDNKYNRKADDLRKGSDKANATYTERLKPLQAEIDDLHNQKMDTYSSGGGVAIEERKLRRSELNAQLAAARNRYDTLDAERIAARKSTSEKIKELSDLGHTSKRNRVLGAMGLAGVGTAFAAKKLFDRYNARKQEGI